MLNQINNLTITVFVLIAILLPINVFGNDAITKDQYESFVYNTFESINSNDIEDLEDKLSPKFTNFYEFNKNELSNSLQYVVNADYRIKSVEPFKEGLLIIIEFDIKWSVENSNSFRQTEINGQEAFMYITHDSERVVLEQSDLFEYLIVDDVRNGFSNAVFSVVGLVILVLTLTLFAAIYIILKIKN